MKSISIFLKNIKNLLPYFLLIAIYFFFVNLEASKENSTYFDSGSENEVTDDKSISGEKTFRIRIPVVPYKE